MAHDLELSPQTIYDWRKQHQIDTGQRLALSTVDSAELKSACAELARQRAENAILHRANELLKETLTPKGRSGRSQ